jgi:hypothetical protein
MACEHLSIAQMLGNPLNAIESCKDMRAIGVGLIHFQLYTSSRNLVKRYIFRVSCGT